MEYNINFPNLHIFMDHVGKSISIGDFKIAYYGIVITVGILAGWWLACHKAKKTGQNTDDYLDLGLFAVIFSVIGARLYYVIFQWDVYKSDLLSIFNIREGGLAIYGAVIAAIITTFVFTRKRKIPFGRMADCGVLGLILGQAIGRWGNFFNREAFGEYTDNLFAMQIPLSAVRGTEVTEEMMNYLVVSDGIAYIQVHPTFLYESLWNVGILVLLLIFFNKRKFEGEVFLWYLAGYGIGRFWIESLRTDQLLLPVIDCPVSMVLAAILVVLALIGVGIGRYKTSNKKKIQD